MGATRYEEFCKAHLGKRVEGEQGISPMVDSSFQKGVGEP
jgi:hypothetical protein